MKSPDRIRDDLLCRLARNCAASENPNVASSAIFQMFVILAGESADFPAFSLNTNGDYDVYPNGEELLTGDTHHQFMIKFLELRGPSTTKVD